LTVYFDSSVLAKLYLDEPDSEEVEARARAATLIATSSIAYAEVCAAFARCRRDGRLTDLEYRRVLRQFDADWSAFLTVDVSDALVRSAGALAGQHGLRGADAIQLASFERLLESTEGDEIEFLCADDRLSEAARNLG
jgi:predicted nucleic acid-binding protein